MLGTTRPRSRFLPLAAKSQTRSTTRSTTGGANASQFWARPDSDIRAKSRFGFLGSRRLRPGRAGSANAQHFCQVADDLVRSDGTIRTRCRAVGYPFKSATSFRVRSRTRL